MRIGIFVLCFYLLNLTKAQTIDTAVQYFGTHSASIKAIASDKNGNTYIAGYFRDSLWLNTKDFIKGSPSQSTLFLASIKANGEVGFSKMFNTKTVNRVKLEMDDSGNVFLNAMYRGTVYLDQDGLKDKIIGGAGDQTFILKVGKDGTNKWFVHTTGSGVGTNVEYIDFSVTPYNEIAWMISARGGIKVYSSSTFTSLSYTMGNANAGRYSILAMRTIPGNYRVADYRAILGNSSTTINGYAMAEKDGKIILTGRISSTVDMDPGAGVYNLSGSGDAFYCCLDTQMNFVWAKKSGLERILKFREDAYGRIRGFGSSVGVGTVTLELSALETDGTLHWEYSQSFNAGSMSIEDVDADRGGNVFLAGTFSGSGDFDPTIKSSIAASSRRSPFLVKYDSSSAVLWMVRLNGQTDFGNNGYAVNLNYSNNLTWGGEYNRIVSFTGNASIALPYTTNTVGFMTHLQECASLKSSVSPSDTAVCAGESAVLNIAGAKEVKWLDNNSQTLSRMVKPNASAFYQIEVSDGKGCYKTLLAQVNVNALPLPVITQTGSEIEVAGNWSKIAWYLDGSMVNGANTTKYTPAKSGEVYCVVEDSNGCAGESNKIIFEVGNRTMVHKGGVIVSHGENAVLLSSPNQNNYKLELYGLNGQKVLQAQWKGEYIVHPSSVIKGVYVLVLYSEGGEKLAVQKVCF